MKLDNKTGLHVVLGIALLLRIAYWQRALIGGDSIGYAIGGLGTWIAHPPGFFGVCFTGWLVNQAVGNIIQSLILINVVASLVGIYFCHRLGEAFGLTGRNALLATTAYAFSVNLDYFSVTTLSYPVEGMFATMFALACRRAIQQQSTRHALAATLLLAIGGAFRQTTFTFLTPLWIFTIWQAGQIRIQRLALHLLVGLPLVWGWTQANKHYLAAYQGDMNRDVAHDFWQLAMMMASNHDATVLGLDENVKDEATTQYHMPFVEILTWVDEHAGTHFMPDYRNYSAPPPDFFHASRLSALQLGKLGFYLLFSLPCLALLPVLIFRPRRLFASFEKGELGFFVAWMFPVGSFFIFGHLGSFGYLQIFLSGFAVLTVLLLSRAFRPADADEAKPAPWMNWQRAHAFLTALGLGFFLFAKPHQSAVAREKLADVIALQFTGAAIRQGYFVVRANTNKPGPMQPDDWQRCRTDADIIQWWSTQKGAKIALRQPHVVR